MIACSGGGGEALDLISVIYEFETEMEKSRPRFGPSRGPGVVKEWLTSDEKHQMAGAHALELTRSRQLVGHSRCSCVHAATSILR